MNSLKTLISRNISQVLLDVRQLEKKGLYDDAVLTLQDIWPDKTQLPISEGLSKSEAADIYLRCGSIWGFYGHSRRIDNAQELSKDLITRALDIFSEIDDPEKSAECENYIGLGYWRTGEFNEAEIWISSALGHDISDRSEARLFSHILKGLVLLGKRDYQAIDAEFRLLENDFSHCNDHFLKGNFFNNYGLALKNLGQFNKALGLLSLGRTHFNLAGHLIYTALAENNISQIFRQLGNYEEAHSAIDRASAAFANAGDETRSGFSLDTKALIFIEENKFSEAIEAAAEGIKLLRKSENAAYLSETLITQAKAMLFNGHSSESLIVFSEAVELARTQISEDIALKYAQDFMESIQQLKISERIADEHRVIDQIKDLQLELPQEISGFENYQGVWIRNENLADYGLKKDTMAIIADTSVERGNLAAVRELATGEVYCGVFDTEFDIVCIESMDMPPNIFNVNEIVLLGKIVGFCIPEPNDTKTVVTAIN